MLGDEHSLLGDLVVDGIEVCGRGCRRRGGGSDPGFHGRDLRLECGNLNPRGVDHLIRNREDRSGLRDVLRQQRDAVTNDLAEVAEAFTNLLEFERNAAVAVNGIRGQFLFQRSNSKRDLVQLVDDRDALGLAFGFGLLVIVDVPPQRHDVVGKNSGASVANHRCDVLRLASDFGLLSERLELTANFARQVR